MKKSDFIAHKQQIQQTNIEHHAQEKRIPAFLAKREWEHEYRNPIKGSPTLGKKPDLFKQ